MTVDLSTAFGRLRLRNPIGTASGTFGYGLEFVDYLDLATLGAISVKGLSRRPCHGNPPPRICETDAGMLNAIGLQNVGVDAFLEEKLPELARLGATVIANVWGDTEDDFVAVVERIGGDRRVAAIEVNVSCPNVVTGGMIFGNNPEALSALVKRIRAATPTGRISSHRRARPWTLAPTLSLSSTRSSASRSISNAASRRSGSRRAGCRGPRSARSRCAWCGK